MKKIKLLSALTILIISFLSVNAQQLSVTYSARFNTDFPNLFKEMKLPEDMRQALTNAYSTIEFSYMLVYDDGESEFRMVPSDKKQEISFMGQKINIGATTKKLSKNIFYNNYASGLMINQQYFLGKLFLIKDSIQIETFEEVKESCKEILGYKCKKAVSKDGKQFIWFTEYIPVSAGPIITNMKGLILEANINQYKYTAVKVENKLDHPISVPTKGKKMNYAEFEKMVKKKTEILTKGIGME